MVIKKVSNVDKLIDASYSFTNNVLALLVIFILLRLFEAFVLTISFSLNSEAIMHNLKGILLDMYVVFKLSGLLILPYFALSLLRKSIAQGFFLLIGVAAVLLSLGLQIYFATTRVLLGSDVYTYSISEIKETMRASSSVSVVNLIPFIVFPVLFLVIWHYMERARFRKMFYFIFYPIVGLIILTSGYSVSASANTGNFSSFIETNKLGYFSERTLEYIIDREKADAYKSELGTELAMESAGTSTFKYVSKDYPLLHVEQSHDVLAPFFDTTKAKPNIVIILVESLGRSYSGKGSEYGSFTPFLDSLADKGLYFENFLSTAGRTFEVLPSVLASLPFGEKGFAEYGDKMPKHNSLVSILGANGYDSQFIYGGDSKFDEMALFLKRQGITDIFDVNNSWGNAQKLPPNDAGFSWGYGDRDILSKALAFNTAGSKPNLTIALTLAMHDPFRIPDQDHYNKRVMQQLSGNAVPERFRNFLKGFQQQLATVCFFDDALKHFFKEFAAKPSFKNTIFIITGDHRMPEIPIGDQIDRYRVPLVIYSPMITRPARFSSVSSHLDITPSMLALLSGKAGITIPRYSSWLGAGLDTVRTYRNIRTQPFMENKNSISCFLKGDYFLAMGKLFKVSNHLTLDPVDDEGKLKDMDAKLEAFKKVNIYVCANNRIWPDSLLVGGPVNSKR